MTAAVKKKPAGNRYGHDPEDNAVVPDPKVEALQHRLELIDKRLAEISIKQTKVDPEGEQARELIFEKGDTLDLRRVTAAALADATTLPTVDAAARRRATIDAMEAEQRTELLSWIARLEGENDYRQAPLYRTQLLTLREEIERQIDMTQGIAKVIILMDGQLSAFETTPAVVADFVKVALANPAAHPPRIIKNLHIDEISAVRRPAAERALAVAIK